MTQGFKVLASPLTHHFFRFGCESSWLTVCRPLQELQQLHWRVLAGLTNSLESRANRDCISLGPNIVAFWKCKGFPHVYPGPNALCAIATRPPFQLRLRTPKSRVGTWRGAGIVSTRSHLLSHRLHDVRQRTTTSLPRQPLRDYLCLLLHIFHVVLYTECSS